MPTQTLRRGVLRWRGVVKVKGKTLSTKWFGAGRREQRKAIEWEVQENKRIQEESKKPIPTESVTLFAWATNYLDDIQQRKSKLNYFVKRSVFRRLSSMVGDDCEISHLTPAIALKFLRQRFVSCSGYSANRDRQILGAAWEWGRRLVEGFPNLANPFLTVERFPEDPKPRYVPLLEDFDEILDTAEGQDLVMLKAFINLAARRSEIFRLKWADVDFREGMVSLKTRKTKDGSWRVDHIPMSTELRQTLLRWWQERPIKSEYVFCMLDNAYAARHNPGDPFKSRCHFMKKLCLRAGVKAFGFHAIRHLSAVILYKAGEPLAKIQKILRHQNATTTNRYLKSLGFEIEEIRSSVEVLARGAAKVIPLPQKSEAL